jgi:hypothetical protein
MVYDFEIEKNLAGSFRGVIEPLSRRLTVRIEENHEYPLVRIVMTQPILERGISQAQIQDVTTTPTQQHS